MVRAPPIRPDYAAARERDDPAARRAALVTSLTRAAIAIGMGTLDRNIIGANYARSQWGGDSRVELLMRAAVSPTGLATTPALAHVTTAFLEALVPVSAGADLLARGIGLSFAGAAQVTVPAIAIPIADFVGEGLPIPVVTAPTSAGATLTPHKIAAIAVLTAEMLRSPNAEALVKQALIEATGPAIDKVLLSANAAGTDRPAGLLNGIAALTATASGPAKGEVLVDDLQKLASAVAPVSGNGELVLVASPDAAVALTLRLPQAVQWPVLTSSSLPARTVIAVAANAVVSAVEGAPQISSGPHPSLHLDTAPGAILAAGGTVTTTFQADTVALKLRWPISWALRASNGLAWMQGVNW
jgi:hypothetical protein